MTEEEKAARLAGDLYNARAALRALFPDTYFDQIAPIVAMLREVSAKRGESLLETATRAANEASADGDSALGAWYIAAAVEALEPSE